jgi:fused signal recognition particle receptor
LGPALASECIAQAKKIDGESPQESLFHFLSSKLSSKSHEMNLSNSTSTILVVGVNGTGKTTSVAKLAKFYKSSGKSVLMAAGDTFRAAAVDQLQTWGIRMDVPVIAGQENGDPASVAFDAAKQAQTNEVDVLIIDTAGRLHNKTDLMLELTKVKRVVEKTSPVNEVLLVIDATTGQNGLAQARIFSESVDVTGVILTKMDGSAKGGVALAIEAELGIPIKWIGTGESEGDFSPFNPEAYLKSLLT